MNVWLLKVIGPIAVFLREIWYELLLYIKIYFGIQWTFLTLPWVLQDTVKRFFRSFVSLLCQKLWLLFLPVVIGITAVGIMVFFFPGGIVKREAEAPEPLSVTDLLRVQGRLEAQGEMTEDLRTCLDLALQEFMREPPSIQDNAKMLIQCRGTVLEFKSGDGEHELYVYYSNGEPRYDVKEPTIDVYLDRLRSHPEQLSGENLLRVQNKLEAWGKLTSELRDCFIHAQEKFQQEPVYVQQNTKMLIQSGGTVLVFLSGKGECEISVFYRNRELQYHVKETTIDVYLARLRFHPELLSVENLLSVQNRLEAGEKMTEVLRQCFELTLKKFPKEPLCLQNNARLVISTVGIELVFLSGKGENEINVYYDNWWILQYVVKVSGWWACIARNMLTIVLITIPILICQMIISRQTRQPRIKSLT